MPSSRPQTILRLPTELSKKIELKQKELSLKAGKYVSKNALLIEIIEYFFRISPEEGKELQSKSSGV